MSRCQDDRREQPASPPQTTGPRGDAASRRGDTGDIDSAGDETGCRAGGRRAGGGGRSADRTTAGYFGCGVDGDTAWPRSNRATDTASRPSPAGRRPPFPAPPPMSRWPRRKGKQTRRKPQRSRWWTLIRHNVRPFPATGVPEEGGQTAAAKPPTR